MWMERILVGRVEKVARVGTIAKVEEGIGIGKEYADVRSNIDTIDDKLLSNKGVE